MEMERLHRSRKATEYRVRNQTRALRKIVTDIHWIQLRKIVTDIHWIQLRKIVSVIRIKSPISD